MGLRTLQDPHIPQTSRCGPAAWDLPVSSGASPSPSSLTNSPKLAWAWGSPLHSPDPCTPPAAALTTLDCPCLCSSAPPAPAGFPRFCSLAGRENKVYTHCCWLPSQKLLKPCSLSQLWDEMAKRWPAEELFWLPNMQMRSRMWLPSLILDCLAALQCLLYHTRPSHSHDSEPFTSLEQCPSPA